MASSRRASRAVQSVPAVIDEPVRRSRRTLHDGPGLTGLIWWEDGWPVKVYSPSFEAPLLGSKAVAFLKSVGWEQPNS